jgi:hypothetical protein
MGFYDEKMTLEEHIIESLPHLIGNVPIVRLVNISFDRIECENRFLYYYDIISKYLNVTAITYDDHLCRMISNDWFRPSITNFPFSQVCRL